MAALFGQSGDGRREPKSLVEFRAGKMKKNGTTVTADTRKGLIYLKMDDTLLHFCWKDRQTGEIVDDFIIFPGDAEMKLVPKCSTGRVVLLKFRDSTSRRFFYWLQEPKDDKDEALLRKVNELIENPPDPSQATEGMGGAQGLPPGFLGVPASQLQSLLGMGGGGGGSRVVDHHQLMELLNSGALGGALSPFQGGNTGSSSSRPASTPASAPAPSTTTPPQLPPRQTRPQLQLGDLQHILSSMNIPTPEREQRAPPEDQVGLTEVVTPEVLRPLSGSPEVQQQVSSHLPPSSDSTETVLTSPQFQQALGVFGSALQSGQLGPLMSQFGLGQQVVQAASTGDVSGFAEALQGELRGTTEEPTQDSGSGQKETEEERDTPDGDERDSGSNQ